MKKINTFSNFVYQFVFTTLCLLSIGVGQVWADSHFWLIGHPVDSDWGKTDNNKIENVYPGSSDTYYIDVYLKQNEEFALHNGGDRYSPSQQSWGVKIGDAAQSHGYDNTSMGSWKYTGESGWVRICMNQKGIGYASHGNDEYFPDVWLENPVASYVQSVLNSEKVMFYFGNKWSASREFLYNSSSDHKFITSFSEPIVYNTGGSDYYLGYACQVSRSYNITHTKYSNWNGNATSELVQAGKAYVNTGDANKDSWSSTSASSFLETEKTVAVGTVNLGLSVSGYGVNSVVGRAQSVKYYHKKSGAASWTEFDPATEGNTLTAGTYTIAALVTDGNIYVRSTNEVSLTVEASSVLYDLAYGAADGCTSMGFVTARVGATYETGADVVDDKVREGSTIWFKATANPGYEFVDWCDKDGSNEKGWGGDNPKHYENVTYNINMYAKFRNIQYSVTYGAWSNGHGSVEGTVASGSQQNSGTEVTLTATPNEGYYLRGWYSDAEGTNRLRYAVKADEYKYTVALDENKTVYAKFEQIPTGIQLDGNLSGRSWNNCMPATSSTTNSYTWILPNSSNSNNEFCIKNSSCSGDPLLKANSSDATYSDDGCTLGQADNGNYQISNDEKVVTITVTYGSGIHVTATAMACPAIDWAGVEDTYYVYVGENLNLPTETSNATLSWSGSSKLTDNVYHSDAPHNSEGLVATATSTCHSSVTARKENVNVRAYQYMVKYKNSTNNATWHVFWMHPAYTSGKHYATTTYGSSNSADIIVNFKNTTVKDGDEFNDLSYLGVYATREGIPVDGGITAGDNIYIIYTPDGGASRDGSFAIKKRESVTFSFTPTYTMTGFALDPGSASVNVQRITGSTITKQYRIGDGIWTDWTESLVPEVAGTYQFRAKVHGTTAIGEKDCFSNVVEVTITKPTISSIETGSYPRIGNDVIVTPHVEGLQGGKTYAYCWSLLDKDGNVLTPEVTFTDNGNGTYTFQAPSEADMYKLKLDIHLDDCNGTLIVSKTQNIEIMGDQIVVKAAMGANENFWTGMAVRYDTGVSETGWQNALMTYLGKGRDGKNWYQFVFSAAVADWGHDYLIFDAKDIVNGPQGNESQTANIQMPQENKCYLIKTTKSGGNNNRDYMETACPDVPEVEIISKGQVVVGGTYTISAQHFMIGGEVSYEYEVTKGSSPVGLTNGNQIVGCTAGTYTIVAHAKVNGETVASSDSFTLLCADASVTALTSQSNVDMNANVTLSANPSGFTSAATYQWYVKLPSTSMFTAIPKFTFAEVTYQVKKTGMYTFKVIVTEDGVSREGTVDVTVNAQTYYMKYDNKPGTDSYWVWTGAMTYDATEGVYFVEALYENDGVNINTSRSGSDLPLYSFDNPNQVTFEGGRSSYTWGGENVIFFYDPIADHITVRKNTTDYYRIQSVTENGVFYSNSVTFTGAESLDVSFYATAGGSSELKWQKFTNSGWEDQSVSVSASGITESGVYTAKVTSAGVLSDVAEYTGYYYIFGAITSTTEMNESNQMTQFHKLDEREFYDHYFCKYDNHSTNLSATVGNSINHNLAQPLSNDKYTSEVSVRYAYDSETNYFGRAVLRASMHDNFLRLWGSNVSAEENGSKPLNSLTEAEHFKTFTDGSDWVYTTYIYATAPASVKIAARTPNDDGWQYLLDAGGSEQVSRDIYNCLGTYRSELRFMVTYDFKTNRVIAAWAPSGDETFSESISVDADLIIVRDARNTEDVTIFSLQNDAKVTIIRKVYTALQLKRNDLFEGDDHHYKDGLRSQLFQISIPYTMDLMQITGLFDYGIKMNLQTYMGELRAMWGWQTYIETFWYNLAYLPSSKITAQRGYVLQHSLQYGDFKDVGEVSQITLFFPSPTKDDGYVIGPSSNYGTTVFAPITCSKSGREIIDSNWRCIGLPGFFDASVATATPDDAAGGTNNQETNEVTPFRTLHWVYDWNGEYMSYTAYKATEFRFKATKSYMVQYAGTVTWGDPVENGEGHTPYYPVEEPSPVAARQTAVSAKSEGEYCLRLGSETGDFLDQTYVVLDRRAADDYEMNIDLQKSMTDGAPQIYSSVGDQLYAANTVCDTTQRMALGTNLPNEDLYTLSMSNMTTGSRVPYLYDAWLDTYTNMATDCYTFSGTTGKQMGRFYLLFDYHAPAVPTDWESLSGESFTAAWVDGKIVLTGLTDHDVELYDAAGRMIYRSQLDSGNAIPAPPATGVYLVRNGANTTKIVIR